MAKLKSKPQTLQKIESLINDLSELIVDDEAVASQLPRLTDMLTQMYDEMLLIFGRTDDDMRGINKMLRGLISI
jgi:hypothetical protein